MVALYRSLRRVARLYDANPALKALIAAPELLSAPPPALAPPLATTQPVGRMLKHFRHSFLREAPFYDPVDDFSLVEEVQVREMGAEGMPFADSSRGACCGALVRGIV